MVYIDREKIIEHIEEFYEKVPLDSDDRHLIAGFKAYIENLPTADVVEIKHGEWILAKTEFGWNGSEYPTEYKCSLCGRTAKQKEPYCHCGAKMDGGKRE